MSRNIPAKKSLGQNFLADPNVVSKIIQAAGITPDDTVLEIGPGTGVMTREPNRMRVVAVAQWARVTYTSRLIDCESEMPSRS